MASSRLFCINMLMVRSLLLKTTKKKQLLIRITTMMTMILQSEEEIEVVHVFNNQLILQLMRKSFILINILKSYNPI